MTQEVLNLLQSPSAESTEPQANIEPEAPSSPPAQAASPQIPNQSPAERVRFGKEEGRSGVQFSPDSPRIPARSPAKRVWAGEEEGTGEYGAFANSGSGMKPVSSDVDPSILSHLGSLRAQEAELRREIPDFRLEDAFQDTDFLRLTSPTVGISVRRAYFALHAPEMERRAAEESARRLAQSVASGARRPREGGGHTAAALTAADPARLDPAQRRALKERITAAAARGEKIYP